MKLIIKIWFEDDTLFGMSDKGEIFHQSLLWYPRLLKASDEDRLSYDYGLDGIHWRGLDEDVSFESFFYDDAEPSALQRFFLEHPEINIREFADIIGENHATLSDYVNGFKKPSPEKENEIIERIKSFNKEIKDLHTA